MSRTVIHRNRTLTFNGKVYHVLAPGPQWGYYSITTESGVWVADGFDTLTEIRDYVDQARREGWERLGEAR